LLQNLAYHGDALHAPIPPISNRFTL
jgi:hypothetical protein